MCSTELLTCAISLHPYVSLNRQFQVGCQHCDGDCDIQIYHSATITNDDGFVPLFVDTYKISLIKTTSSPPRTTPPPPSLPGAKVASKVVLKTSSFPTATALTMGYQHHSLYQVCPEKKWYDGGAWKRYRCIMHHLHLFWNISKTDAQVFLAWIRNSFSITSSCPPRQSKRIDRHGI